MRGWWMLIAIGCGAEAEAPELLRFELSPGVGTAGTEVTSEVAVQHFQLTGHLDDKDDGHDHDHENGKSKGMTGHVHIYLDDLMTNPVLQQVTEVERFTIPADTEIGEHTIIARLHDATHRIIEPQVTLEVAFEVTE
ncbi:MAG: hypothetical protein AAGA48_09125 [Myxococcota bacterium]